MVVKRVVDRERERERDRATEERLFYFCHDLFIFDGHNKIIC